MTLNQSRTSAAPPQEVRPWPALYALVLGFFMILVDMTIVTVATPTITEKLHTDVNSVIWVSSAYMLAYAVPILITGRLGDRIGSKYLYMAGLVIFTLASLWCGLTDSIGMLILARVVQGLGASMITPQTMAIITRIFPAAERGKAMAIWGATAGAAMVVGPVLGGVLTSGLGWEWIFFVNVPVGVVALAMAWKLVPVLPTHEHSFDWLGVVLSGIGLFLLAFGIQEGHAKHWNSWIIAMIVGGMVVLALFVVWQGMNKREPLVPLSLFRDRNFSVSNVAITVMGFIGASFGFPLMLYAQVVRHDSATQAALLMVPMAIMSIVLAKPVGNLTDRMHPRIIMSIGFGLSLIGALALTTQLTVSAPIWSLCVCQVCLGAGNAFVWAPTAATANRNLPLHLAGAGAGVYNAVRQVGSVVGAAVIAVAMDSLLAHYLPGTNSDTISPASFANPHFGDLFAHAMRDSFLITALVYVIGLIAVLFYEAPKHAGYGGETGGAPSAATAAAAAAH